MGGASTVSQSDGVDAVPSWSPDSGVLELWQRLSDESDVQCEGRAAEAYQ